MDNDIRDESKGRRAYVIYLFLIIFILPWLVDFTLNLVGISFNESNYLVSGTQNGHFVQGVRFGLLSAWYLQIPLFAFITYRRVSDTNLSIWLTPIFMLPFVNLFMWFWPPKCKA